MIIVNIDLKDKEFEKKTGQGISLAASLLICQKAALREIF